MKKNLLDRKAFTMVELLIAMTILSVGILGIAGLAGTALKSSNYSQSMTQANNLAQDRIEAMQSIDFNKLQATDTTTTRTDLRRNCTQTVVSASAPEWRCDPVTPAITIGGKSYNWLYTVKYIDTDNSGTANPGVDLLKRVDVTVSWTDPLWRTTKSVTVTTLMTRR